MRAGFLRRLNGDLPSQPDAEVLAVSIALNLAEVLNVRSGSCASRPDMGLPAVSPVQLQGDVVQSARLAEVIVLQTKLFEPRLTGVQVQPTPANAGLLPFRLSAAFEYLYDQWQVEYRIQIDNDSHVAVHCTGLQAEGALRRV